MREAKPGGGVRVLPSILTYAGRVRPHVSRVVRRAIERRPEEEHEPSGVADEPRVGGA
jgi:hypothetical protein